MHKTFVEYGAELEIAERSLNGGLQVTLEFYLDGFEYTIIDNYEGRPEFEIPDDLVRETEWFVNQLKSKHHVFYVHQVMRIRSVRIRQRRPRTRDVKIIEAPDKAEIGELPSDADWNEGERLQAEHERMNDDGQEEPQQGGHL